MEDKVRIGYGYDIHRLQEGRPLVLGGVEIDFEQGLAGHSDADVLIHAVCDALLGALALGDIGTHFPDTDPQYRGADSRAFLRAAARMIKERGWRVGNIDCTVVAEQPKLAPHISRMREVMAGELDADPNRLSVKATTGEGMGPEGRGEGISARAVALLVPFHG
ncbi:MAG: 2-C-methyl-D-erythritol 2,4-cyclodiphosphate synthase [Balneolaceae bacterium]|nr:2-C-methyl-D-erythritol 2,4-cyclodiphosphate synthase [Balneolaceae bacterium]